MTENVEQSKQPENNQQTIPSNPENVDTLVDFLPIDKQVLSEYEAERLERLINQRSPYRKTD